MARRCMDDEIPPRFKWNQLTEHIGECLKGSMYACSG